jgi:hypothetical protein
LARDWLRYSQLFAEYAKRKRARDALAAEVKDAEPTGPDLSRLVGSPYPEQAAAVNDPARNVAILGTRRSGKSRGFLRKLCHDAVAVPGTYQIYINTSWPECRRIAWNGNPRRRDALLPLNEDFGLGAVPLKSERTLTFPNGSVVECVPADDLPAIERALGVGADRIWIDEAQKMPHLDYAIKEVLGPTMTDFDGQIVLTGTPSINCAGLFYDVTKPDSDLTGWAVHGLNVTKNPFFGKTEKERFAKTVLRYCIKYNLELGDPVVRRMWFGEWVLEDASFVYHVHRVPDEELLYAPARWVDGQRPNNEWLGGVPDLTAALADLPRRPDGSGYDWLFGLGADTGYEPDPFAEVLWAWTWELPELYEVFSWKKLRTSTNDQNDAIQDVMRRVNPVFIEADATKSAVKGWSEQWQERYPLPIEEAKKSHKATYQEFLNNDIRAGHAKLRKGGPLHEEMKRLSWTPQKGNARRQEDVQRGKDGKKKYPNDCCDAALYAHRAASHHRYRPEEPAPEYGTREYWEREDELEYQQEIEELERLEEEGPYGLWN